MLHGNQCSRPLVGNQLDLSGQLSLHEVVFLGLGMQPRSFVLHGVTLLSVIGLKMLSCYSNTTSGSVQHHFCFVMFGFGEYH